MGFVPDRLQPHARLACGFCGIQDWRIVSVISELLKMLGAGSPMTLQQMADKLRTTCDIVQDMLEMLSKKGVVEKIEACYTSSACENCKMKCGCNATQTDNALPKAVYRLKKA